MMNNAGILSKLRPTPNLANTDSTISRIWGAYAD